MHLLFIHKWILARIISRTVKRGSRDFPSICSGLSIPAISSIVGAISIISATASVSVPGTMPGPRIIRGTLQHRCFSSHYVNLFSIQKDSLSVPDVKFIWLPLFNWHPKLPKVVTMVWWEDNVGVAQIRYLVEEALYKIVNREQGPLPISVYSEIGSLFLVSCHYEFSFFAPKKASTTQYIGQGNVWNLRKCLACQFPPLQ